MPSEIRILHALGDVGLLEEGFAIPLGVNQLIQLLDLITESDREGIGLELTSVAHGFHAAAVLSMADKSMDFGSRGVSFTNSAPASAVVGESQAVSLLTRDRRPKSMRCLVQCLRLWIPCMDISQQGKASSEMIIIYYLLILYIFIYINNATILF